jgi:feruloyl esterase
MMTAAANKCIWLLGAWVACASQLQAAPAPAGATDADLQSLCQPDALQAIAAKVVTGKVSVQQLVNGQFKSAARFVAATGNLPAYCQVSGTFVTNASTGKTSGFLATLPARWNGKYLQIGCSGHCGQFFVSDAATASVTVTTQGHPGDIIGRGYASFATDEGHAGISASGWETNDDAVTDFYYRAQKTLTHVGKEFTTAFYGQLNDQRRKIARSYFTGCSGGGRDAYVAASYFPEEFDGIIAGSAYNLIGISLHAVGAATAKARTPGGNVPDALLALVDPIVKAKCDALDGVQDGIIQNPQACDFRPDRDLPKCADAADGKCFTAAQIETLSVAYSALTDEKGNVIQPGYSVSEMLSPSLGGLAALGNASMKLMVHKDPDFPLESLYKFSSGDSGAVTAFHAILPRAEVDKAMTSARMGIGHFPENANNLIQLNRKMLIWHNFSDEKLSPYTGINHYKQLAKLHGGYAKLQENVRLFMMPGTSHCGGGAEPVGPNNFDALTAMENWVEKGIAPDALPAKLYVPILTGGVQFDKPRDRTMPLCKFPEMAHYSGKGDINDASNWSCPASDKSLLKIGESGRQAGVVE